MKTGTQDFECQYSLRPPPEEDVIWRKDIAPRLTGAAQNVVQICQYGFTEMVNNAIEHSGSRIIKIEISRNAENIRFAVIDYGIGIFTKIKNELDLEEAEHAVLELAKGKFTSDPQRHSGEGIFFTSRIFDVFSIASENLSFSWIKNGGRIEVSHIDRCQGTAVTMEINPESKLALADVFNEYADPDKQPGFYRTAIPVQLMQYADESLMSRSQAKRLMNRFDRFLEITLDFTGVDFIGQGFADEIFRVFVQAHPGIRLIPLNCGETVAKMIAHVGGKTGDTSA